MRDATKKLIPALALCMALTSCGTLFPQASSPSDEPTESLPSDVEPSESPSEVVSHADKVFSVNYDPDGSMNPLLGTNRYNERLFGLLYESLFVLSPELEPVPVLCESYKTDDGLIYTFKLREGVRFHDGSILTADDVTYTLNIARGTDKYAARLSDIASVQTTQSGEVEIRLKRANRFLPALLDVPIIKNGSADDDAPEGTGPYIMGNGVLSAFVSHRDYTSASLRRIYLREIPESDLAEAFSERTVDILDYDPTGASRLNIHMLHETRYYKTTQLVYLGVNASRGVLSNLAVRQAISRLVDRASIAARSFAGLAEPTAFLLDAGVAGWDPALAESYAYSRQSFRRLATGAGLEDTDMDGRLDYAGESFELRLIVNSESEAKVSAAEMIANELINVGFNVKLEELDFNAYRQALTNGSFDLYIGEVKLRADLDLTALLTGSLSFGGSGAERYGELINAYLAAPEEERAAAAAELCIYAAEDCSVIPIAYKRAQVLTHVGVVSGAEPGQSNIFTGILGWTVDPARD